MKCKGIALVVAVAIVGATLESGEQSPCEHACNWVADQPHVPHEPRVPIPTRAAIEFVASGSSAPNVPLIPYDGSSADAVIRQHYDRQAVQTFVASSPLLLLG
jgi:hypothetical protein